uniref:Riboflavin transporter n=2 Tax=Parascaris univalens TaxID=6257 RepID=A0A914ZFM6_PARUN
LIKPLLAVGLFIVSSSPLSVLFRMSASGITGVRKSSAEKLVKGHSAERAQKHSAAEKMKGGRIPLKAAATINSFGDINPALLDLLYNKLGGQLANDVKDLEEKSGIKREQFVYALALFVAIYLVVGSEAALMCNLIGFIYPAFATLQISNINILFPFKLLFSLFILLSIFMFLFISYIFLMFHYFETIKSNKKFYRKKSQSV